MSCSNSAVAPLVIPYGNVSFSGNTVPIQRGIGLELGNPPQLLSFQPSLIDDSLALADPAHCNNGNSNVTCAGAWGGLYDSGSSNTYYPVSQQTWNGTHNTPDGRTPTTWFNEEVRVAGKSLYGYPVTRFDPNIYSNMLGVNENATFLDIAVSSGIAPTKAWGMWVGSTDPNNEVNGSLVIGGYDKARVSGDFTTFNATSECLACVYVKSIQYNAPGGQNTSLLESSSNTPLTVSLSPEIMDVEMPIAAFNTFVQTTGATQYTAQNKFGWPAGTQLGTVTIGFFNNYEVTIAAEELWQPFTGYDSSGTYTTLNDSITISRLVNRTDGLTPNFGFPFFASTYMTFHPEEKYFALAKPVRDANVQPSIQSFCGSNGTTTNEPGSSSGNTSSSSSSGSSSHAGAIAGGVVGGIAGLALIAALVWFLMRRRRKARAAPVAMTSAQEKPIAGDTKDPLLHDHSAVPSELPLYKEQPFVQHPSEMAATDVRPELPAQGVRHEMPS